MYRPDLLPDAHGHFGPYGGRFVPETLVSALDELEREYQKARIDPEFRKEFSYLLSDYCGRPTPLYFAERLTQRLGRSQDLSKARRPAAHRRPQDQQCDRPGLLCKRMGKKRVIAETGAGQHGVATATVAARFGFECVIYMGAVDMKRQSLNVSRMEFLGARVVAVTAGQATLKEAINEAMRDWVTNVRSTHYVLGTAYGSHPYPMMVRDFHRIIGDETRRQVLQREERLPRPAYRLRGRRKQCDRTLLSFSRRRKRENDWGRGWRRRDCARTPCGPFSRWKTGRIAGREDLAARE